MSIVVREVTKFYGKQKALDVVSFSIHSGEIAGFIGPNGAGKTTMMKILTGYIPPGSGEVRILDQDVLEDSLRIRRQIGYLPENNPLYPDMYVHEYLKYVADIYTLGRNGRSRIREIIERTGLGPEQKKKIGALSKGFRQRVGLAQALIHDPSVLILDEPTSGLDPNQIVDIRNLISEVGKQKTVLLSTHIMQEVEAICDRIIIIHQGKIVADEEAKNIYQKIPVLYQTVLVEFNAPITKEKIESVDGVIRAVPVDAHRWLIQGDAARDIRGDLFNLAVQNNLQLLSLQKQEKSLEEVFQELTR
jgi:ABC-2 type transport system ATP-binding protein